ncbi:hypothetical protein RvY_11549 [Ramazzottius varieornatus]|uniref:Uncharacterized protein n=1 Tax=Ramazzottius varieornatus TaxID=947166 RepID=A0A1D1VGG8_RAMVA|nr:hypothetical protein RvY_11549 [Ramazzottius varieornatus]
MTLSGNKKPSSTRRKFLSYDGVVEGHETRKLDLEAEKIVISPRKTLALEKAAGYQHEKRIEALQTTRSRSQTNRSAVRKSLVRDSTCEHQTAAREERSSTTVIPRIHVLLAPLV